MTTGEAAITAGVSRATIVYACRHGKLHHALHESGDRSEPWRVISDADLRAWMHERDVLRRAADARRERNRHAHQKGEARAKAREAKRAALLATLPEGMLARWREHGWLPAVEVA